MIQIKNLSKSWKTKGTNLTAIDNLSLSVNKGEFISIIGPSGCGKTTLLRLISGLVKPTRGTIEIDEDLSKRNSIKKLSIAFQNPILLNWRTVEENIRLPLELDKNLKVNHISEIINLVRLGGFEKSYPFELSGGMRQRVSLARALIVNPSLLLLDEPFGALDELNRNKLNLELLKIHKKINSTILFVTHSISEAVFLSDRVVIMSKRPSKVKDIVKISLPSKRNIELKETEEFQEYVKCIRQKMN